MTLRSKQLKIHPGEMSFPGGRYEEEDGNLLSTALRETREEIGLDLNGVLVNATLPVVTTLTGYQNIIITLLRNKNYVEKADKWVADVKLKCSNLIYKRIGLKKKDFSLEFRLIGKNASFGKLETQISNPFELGVMALVTAKEQKTTDEISQMLNPLLLHHPLTTDEELPTFAFPFSPAEIRRGPIYSFCLHHTWELNDPLEIFNKEILDIG